MGLNLSAKMCGKKKTECLKSLVNRNSQSMSMDDFPSDNDDISLSDHDDCDEECDVIDGEEVEAEDEPVPEEEEDDDVTGNPDEELDELHEDYTDTDAVDLLDILEEEPAPSRSKNHHQPKIKTAPARMAMSWEELEQEVRDPFLILDPDQTYVRPPVVPPIAEADVMRLYKSYFYRHSLVRQQIEAFDFFMDNTLPAIIDEKKRAEVISKKCQTKHVINFINMRVTHPMILKDDGECELITPAEAMIRKCTYYSQIMVDVDHQIFNYRPRLGFWLRPHPIMQVLEQYVPTIDPQIIDAMRKLLVSLTPAPVYINNTTLQQNQILLDEPWWRNLENMVKKQYPTWLLTEWWTRVGQCRGSVVYLDVEFVEILREHRINRQVSLYLQPIMVGSKYCANRANDLGVCPYTHGGFFIINGNERVILPQERLKTNYPYVTAGKKKKFLWRSEIRSLNEKKIRSTSTFVLYLSNVAKSGHLPRIMAAVPFLKNQITLAHVFRLIGIHSPSEMRQLILLRSGKVTTRDTHDSFHPYDATIRSILKDDLPHVNLEDLKDILSRKSKEPTREKRINYLNTIFHNEFLPHMGLERNPSTLRAKAIYLGYMVYDLLQVYHGDRPADDRDDFANKRIDTTNLLFGLLIRQYITHFLKKFTSQIHKGTENDKYIFALDIMRSSRRISSDIKYAVASGNWGMSKGGSRQVGVSQLMTRLNPITSICHMRRTNTQIQREGKMTAPRLLHLSSWGLVCCSDTPEGKPCGLVKSLALQVHTRLGYPSQYLIDMIFQCLPLSCIVPLLQVTPELYQEGTWVYVNGALIGLVYAAEAISLVSTLRSWRQIQQIPFDTSITHYPSRRKVMISTDGGCYLRPLFNLANLNQFATIFGYYKNNLFVLWDKMVAHGVIEYLDKEEESTMRVAVQWSDLQQPLTPKEMNFTHLEIHPMNILGVAVSLIPFPQHNQAPRNTYGSAMIKQGPGKVALNAEWRYDPSNSELFYPQRPLVTTQMAEETNFDDIPNGSMAIVAIATYGGDNCEDSIIMNKASCELGHSRTLYEKVYREFIKSSGAEPEHLGIPQDFIPEHSDATTEGLESNQASYIENHFHTAVEQPIRLPPLKSTHKHDVNTPTHAQIVGLKKANYSKLESDGFPALGQEIEENDVIIGKVIQPLDPHKLLPHENVIRDKSIVYKHEEKTRIAKIVLTPAKAGTILANIKTKTQRIPQLGDKFCFTPDHQVWTTQGWKYFTEIDLHRDLIWQIDPRHISSQVTMLATKALGFCHFECRDEIIYHIRNHQVDIKITPEHRLLCVDPSQNLTTHLVPIKDIVANPHSHPNKSHPWFYMLQPVLHPPHDDQKENPQNPQNPQQHQHHELIPIYNHDITILHYSGPVYCLEMPQHTFAVRNSTNHLTCWTGNSSRHGQKGVLSRIMPKEDMPFATRMKNGRTVCIIPDLIINPNCIPSRMTVAQLMEMELGKIAASQGLIGDGTPFKQYELTPEEEAFGISWTEYQQQQQQQQQQTSRKNAHPDATQEPNLTHKKRQHFVLQRKIEYLLHQHGYRRDGKEVFYNGMTGEQIQAAIFVGPAFYQRLKHYVTDKVHARAYGIRQILTHQPVEGRSREGGLRFGEMEKDCTTSHGVSEFAIDRLRNNSDKYDTLICRQCGNLAIPAPPKNTQSHKLLGQTHQPWCKVCQTSSHVVKVTTTYPFMLFVRYMGACHVGMNLQVTPLN